jgi:hypothetical protein
VIRLFATCWIVFLLHSATNISREHYLAFAIGDHLSFRVDEYQGLHPDLFETPGRGWHINSNPGVSMMAAVPYAVARPAIDLVVARVRHGRTAAGAAEPPAYDSPWPMARAFYAEAWRRGLDVKFGLGALVIQAGFMAPLSALAAVGMFLVLRRVFASDRLATWLTLLFAFGTPVFFRTGFLSHNLLVGYAAVLGFVALWNPNQSQRWTERWRVVVAGTRRDGRLLGYTGVVILAGLFSTARAWWSDKRLPGTLAAAWFGLGVLGRWPVWFQWASFGDRSARPAVDATSGLGRCGTGGLPHARPLAATLFDPVRAVCLMPPVLLALQRRGSIEAACSRVARRVPARRLHPVLALAERTTGGHQHGHLIHGHAAVPSCSRRSSCAAAAGSRLRSSGECR